MKLSWIAAAASALGLGARAQPAPQGASSADAAPAPTPGPGAAAEWIEQGNAALQTWDLQKARDCYARAQLADASSALAALNHGFVLLELGQAAVAADLFRQALALQREGDAITADAQFLLGRAQRLLHLPDAALAAFEAAVAARPTFTEAMTEALALAQELQRNELALRWARRLQAAQPSAAADLAVAQALSEVGQHEEALALLDTMLAADATQADTWAGRGNVLLELARPEEALQAFERALALAGPTPAAQTNLANALARLGRTDAALEHYRRVLNEEPSHRGAAFGELLALLEAHRLPEAFSAGQRTQALHPADGDIHWALAVGRFLAGDFDQGWRLHEWRWRAKASQARRPSHGHRVWAEGQELAGRVVLVFAEQGFGDTLQFLRYLPVLAQRAARVYVLVQPGLEELAGSAALLANCVILQPGSAMPACELEIPLMSLPLALGTREDDIPRAIPYLRADPARVERWRDRLAAQGERQLNVGIAWSGSPVHRNDRNRSIPLETFRAMAAPGCRFISLQPEVRASDRAAFAQWPGLLPWGSELRSFTDTAALMEALDLIVAVDTSVVHLAGALGRPVHVLLPFYPDWRWMLGRNDSPWYPSARLFRQPAPGDWGTVLAEVHADLAALAAARVR
jgi:tetratricopeptide (TPR) repeat protein